MSIYQSIKTARDTTGEQVHKVVDRKDPLEMGRCKMEAVGFDASGSDNPWVHSGHINSSGGVGEVGPHPIEANDSGATGTHVMARRVDGQTTIASTQIPAGGKGDGEGAPDPSGTNHDVNALFRTKATQGKDVGWDRTQGQNGGYRQSSSLDYAQKEFKNPLNTGFKEASSDESQSRTWGTEQLG
jgi:hypothetical protein